MKRRIISFMLALSLVTSGVSIPQVDAKSKAPKVSKSMTLTIGQSKTIKVKSNGTKVKKKTFKVTTKKGKRVISVSKEGKVKAKKTGSAEVQVTIKYKAGKKLKTKKSYIKIKVTSSKTTVTQKPSSTSNTSATTKPSITTSTPTSEPSETPDDIEPSETPTTKPTETPTTKPTETPSSTATSSPSNPSSTPTTKPTATPGLNLNKDGIKVEGGVLTSYNGSAESIDIPEGVEKIGESALEGQEVKSVSLPRTLKTISAKAFKDCTNLEEVECPESVEEVGDLVWSGCTSLKTLSIPNEDAEIGNSILDGCTSLTSAYIPAVQSNCTHSYMKIKFDATCTAKGKDLSICKDCGNIVDIDVPALGHDAEVIKTDATCTASGKEQKVCKRCEVVLNVDIIPAKGHTEGEYKTEKEPTCEESGTSVKRCTSCNEVLDEKEINSLGHTAGDFVIERNSTCAETGLKVKHCTVCDKRLNNTEEVIEKLPHNYGLWTPVINPTCVLAGNKQRVCEGCGHVDTANIDLLGHDFSDEYTIDKEPTCTEKGSKSQHCSRCDEVQNVTDIPASGHKWGKVSHEWSEDGKSSCTATRVCKADSSHVETSEAVITSEVVQEATCTEKGYTEYTAEFDSLEFGVAVNRIPDIDKKGHNWGEPEYTWSSDGSECTATRVCKNDTSHVETEDATVTSEVKVEPTCTESGTTEYTAKFNKSAFTNQTKDIVDIPAIGHDWGEVKYTWNSDRSKCTATRVCKNDSNHVETETVNVVSTILKNATCTEKGITEYKATFSNSNLGVVVEPITDISELGHSWGEPEYTWESDGSNCTAKRICQNDSKHIQTEGAYTIETNVKKQPTCTEKGVTEYTATFNKPAFATQTKDITDIPSVGHDWEEPEYVWSEDGKSCKATRVCKNDSSHKETEDATITDKVKIAPTCTESGTTEYTATFSNSVFTNQTKNVVDISSTGHSWKESTYTWADDGKKCTATRVCNNDSNHVETEDATITSVVEQSATCTEKGTTKYTAKFNNNAFATQTKSVVDISATGHNWGTVNYSWSADNRSCTAKRICENNSSHIETETKSATVNVKVDATCEGSGTTTYTVTFENTAFETQIKDVQDIDAIGHSYGEPTYTWSADGKSCTAKRICENDSEHIETEEATISDEVKTAATCLTKGTTTYTATFENDAFITQTKDVQDISATGHFWGATTYTWSYDGSSCTARRVCQNDSEHVETEEATMIDRVKIPATCEEDGTTTYTAAFSNPVFAMQTKDVQDIPATGHSYGTAKYTWSADGKSCKARVICSNDASHIIEESGTIKSSVKTSAKCTVKGTTTYTATFGNALFTAQTKDVQDIAATGHTWGTPSYTWSADSNTCIAKRVCTKDSSHTETQSGTVTSAVKTAATCTAKGTTTYIATFENNAFATQTKDVVDIPEKSHTAHDGYCTVCNAKIAGLYDKDGNLLCTWKDSGIDVETNYTDSTYKTSTTSPYYVIKNNHPNTTKVIIPDGVTSIGNDAFYNCSGLTSITIPDGVTSIGKDTFNSCYGLTDITIPESVTSIRSGAFWFCSKLTSITIPSSVTSIGDSAFMDCSKLTSITIPDGVTSIGNNVFNQCEGLTSITIPSSVTSIGDSAFMDCHELTSITIPDGVTSIGDSAFHSSGLTSITIPDSVTSIGNCVFRGCMGLTSITIPDSVTSIGDSAFDTCRSLTSITIPDSVTSIGEMAFSECSELTSITIPDSVTSIGMDAFMGIPVVYYDGDATGSPWGAGKVLKSGLYDENDNLLCTWEDSGIDVENNPLSAYNVITNNYPSTKKVVIPNSVTSIGNMAFCDCTGLTSIIIPDSVTSIGNMAFCDCTGLTSIIIPDSVTSIGNDAFSGCSGLTGITIPSSVTSIGTRAFRDCTGLTSITIPSSVTSIERWAFYRCSELTSVTFKNTSGWYIGTSVGDKTTAISSSDLANTSTAATYLKSTHSGKYWTR